MLVPRNGYCVRHAPVRTTVVTGPPCSGKSTWVRERAGDCDLVLDWDTLSAALTGRSGHDRAPKELLGYVTEARDAVVKRLMQRRVSGEPAAAWLIVTDPDKAATLAKQVGGKVVAMETDIETCVERLHAEPDGRDVAETERFIRSWES